MLRIVLVIVCAVIGAMSTNYGTTTLAAVAGALVGLALWEILHLRQALKNLRDDLDAMRGSMGRQVPTPSAFEPSEPEPEPDFDMPLFETSAPIVEPVMARPASTSSSITPPETPYFVSVNPVVRLVRDYFTGGNALVRTGVVILFIGVAFLLRYLAEHTHVPIEFRLAGIACGAIVLLVLGWRLRLKRPGYALAIQGGAIGILYLTVFAALRLYSLLPPVSAFALLAALSGLCAALAILQNSQAVALLAVTGGFLAPFLASSGEGNHVALFSYFVLLNAAIALIAWFRSWRLLNLAGFAFTFLLGAVWGVLSYRPDEFASSEPFLVAFFLLYVAIAVLYSTRQAPMLRGYFDGTIIFGTPIAAFGLQAAMLRDRPFSLATARWQ